MASSLISSHKIGKTAVKIYIIKETRAWTADSRNKRVNFEEIFMKNGEFQKRKCALKATGWGL